MAGSVLRSSLTASFAIAALGGGMYIASVATPDKMMAAFIAVVCLGGIARGIEGLVEGVREARREKAANCPPMK
jgi:hypothetical protein